MYGPYTGGLGDQTGGGYASQGNAAAASASNFRLEDLLNTMRQFDGAQNAQAQPKPETPAQMAKRVCERASAEGWLLQHVEDRRLHKFQFAKGDQLIESAWREIAQDMLVEACEKLAKHLAI